MKLPNKVVPYKKSIIAKFPTVLAELEKGDKTPAELYKKVNKKVANIAEFTTILNCLYALNKVKFLEGDVLSYVKRD